MTSINTLADTVALLLFQNMKEGLETGRIADLNIVKTEVEAAIAELKQLPEGTTKINDLVGKLLLRIGLLETAAGSTSELAEIRCRLDALEEEVSEIATSMEACNLPVRQQKENAKTHAAVEETKASTTAAFPCLAPAASPPDPVSCLAPSKMAVVSFPGGPRTITIHPPGSPRYQSTIHDKKGDVILTLKSVKPLRREGAFRGPIEDIDWAKIHRVRGRGPEPAKSRAAPPSPRWPGHAQPSSCPPSARDPSEIIARQQQLSRTMQSDASGRVLAPVYLSSAKSPSLPTGMSSSQPQQDPQPPSSGKHDVFTMPLSIPPSPTVGRGKKRTRHNEEDEIIVPYATETRDGASMLIESRASKEPKTPAKCEESQELEGSARRKKLRSSVSTEALPVESPARSHGALEAPHTA